MEWEGGGGTFRIVQRGVEGSGNVEAGRAERMKQPEGATECYDLLLRVYNRTGKHCSPGDVHENKSGDDSSVD